MGAFSYMAENPDYVLEKLGEHFYLFVVSWLIAVAVGLGIAILSTRPGREKAGRVLLSVTGAAQAVPSIAVIAIVFIFLGIGSTPAVFALFVYSLVPITFNSASGFLSVEPSVKASARGMGMRNSQILVKIEIPIAMSAIASGARSAATINIGAAAIASAIGAGGLGEIIFIGLRSMEVGIIIAGALPTAALAVLVDAVLAVVERRITSPGLSMGGGV
jgi:osmoprotectant transport system permease protein